MAQARLHTLHFNVTNTCNLSCSFCYINAVKEKTTDLDIPQIRKLAAEAASVGGKRVIISGGEVFVRKDWLEILEAFADQGFALSIVSNGTLISPERVARVAEFADCNILISLDGDRANHDDIRGREGAHEETVSEIAALREAGIDVQVNATIIKRNLADVPFLARLSRDLNVPVRFSLLNPYNGRGPNLAPDALDVEEILRLRQFCHELRQQGSRVFLNIPPLLLHAEDVLPIRSPSCGWTKSYCGVTYDGNVTICGVAGADESLYVGNVTETPFDELWLTAPLFERLRSMDHHDLTGICGRCPVKAECGGACRLSAYKSKDDFAASYSMCQTFYDLGYIPEDVLDPIESVPREPDRLETEQRIAPTAA